MPRRLDPSKILSGLIAMLLTGWSLSPDACAESPYPGATWASVQPEEHHWSSAKLSDAWLYAQAIGSGAVLVVDDGVVVVFVVFVVGEVVDERVCVVEGVVVAGTPLSPPRDSSTRP